MTSSKKRLSKKKLSQKISELYEYVKPDMKNLPDADQILLGISVKREMTFDQVWVLAHSTFDELVSRFPGNVDDIIWKSQKQRFLNFLDQQQAIELKALFEIKFDGVINVTT